MRIRDDITLSVDHVSKAFFVPNSSNSTLAVLRDIAFEVKDGELVCLVGPSGCGKSTLLRILAGLTKPSSGAVKSGGQVVLGPSPERIIVFQDLNLFGWMTVAQNIKFALEARGVKQDKWDHLVEVSLRKIGLVDFGDYYPSEISGGMRQRLAVARALAAEPRILLMDEPFGALDIETRMGLESDFQEWRGSKGFTTVLVTHDVRQAVFLGDRILVMSPRPGRIKGSVTVPFPYPRAPQLRLSAEFRDVENALAKAVGAEEMEKS